jgi:hypothetical protein
MRKWEKEFGPDWAIPPEIDALVDKGLLEDASWHNDAAPSFWIKDSGGDGETDTLYIFVEHPTEPEVLKPRFTVVFFNRDETAEETDSLAELLYYLKDHWNITLEGA